MKPFRLTGLLRLRQIQEERAAAALAETRRRAAAVEERRAELRAVIGGGPLDLRDGGTVLAVAAARASTAGMLAELAGRQESLLDEVREAEAAHQAATRASAAIDRLRTSHEEAAAAHEIAQEQTALDEIASRLGTQTAPVEPRATTDEGGRHAGR